MIRTRSLTTAALFIAAGIAVSVACHATGIGGRIMLPLHYPALLAGFLLRWRWGFTVGLITPLLSALLTGLPPLIPSAILMVPELSVYGASVGLLRKTFKLIPTLIVSLVLGRLAWGIGFYVLTPVFGLKIPVSAALVSGLITGFPGILAQLIVIPILVLRLEKILEPGRTE